MSEHKNPKSNGNRPICNDSFRWQMTQVEQLLAQPVASTMALRYRLRLVHRLLDQLQTECPTRSPRERSYLWEELARAWFRQSNISKTEYCLRRMAELQPGCADAYLNLGYFLTEMGIRDKAMQAYWEGLGVNPADPYIIYNLASLYRSNGQQRLALKILDDAIMASDEPAILQKAKGDLLYEWGHPGMAAACYELALPQLDRKHAGFVRETLHRLAECYLADGDTDQAIQTWSRTLETFTEDRQALFHLTVLHYQRKAYQQVIDYGMQLLILGERNEDVTRLVNLSQQALGLGQLLYMPTQLLVEKSTSTPSKLDGLSTARMNDYCSDEVRIARDREEYVQEMMARGYSRKDAEAYVDAFI